MWYVVVERILGLKLLSYSTMAYFEILYTEMFAIDILYIPWPAIKVSLRHIIKILDLRMVKAV